ncbi:hypothetical protein LQ954_07980 [Sphingomonas sp. IC-11]|uniref:hypothetical protein n=1 Tax=Sphingomonas sp. IC-11 TaxID=2898528 RepID=UPI001E4C6490|nr:hypothetical protein [Sphingomonas sp. IC-11]MCD2316085.1 hypothetical protein [Sphingomonas sp. IC-11]
MGRRGDEPGGQDGRSAAMATRIHTPARGTLNAASIAVLLAAAFQILTPLLPQLGVGRPIGDQSDAVRTLITPAGWAFSIWGPLYLGSTLFAIYQLLPAQRDNPLIARIRWPAAGAFLGNGLWAAYTQVFGLSAISSAIIILTLACLVAIYRVFASGGRGTGQSGSGRLSTGERWLAYVPLSALTAWLTVATTVNIAASLRFHGVEGGAAAPMIAGAVVVVTGVIAATALIRGRGNLPFALVFLWALAAIFAAGGQEVALVAGATAVAAVLVVAGLVMGMRRG